MADPTVITPAPEGSESVDAGVPATRSGGSGYRPHLDGLRAVAVYLVVIFHAKVDRLAGGFIGVDVFFVLSGYLVTRLLLRDLDGGGSVRFGRFYARRFRRLLPASAVALLVTAVAYTAVAGPGQAVASVSSFRACFLYVANWHFVHQAGGYFGAQVQSSPVLHFWSLAVEEQFYVIWPLVLAGLFWVGRQSGRPVLEVVRVLVAVVAVASLGWALVLQHANVDRAYYGTDARAYQLLAGALLALTPVVFERAKILDPYLPWFGIVAMGGLLLLATSMFDVGPITRGAITVVLVLIILISLEADPTGPMHRVLCTGPFLYLGRISYGIYLWHWPVIVVATLVASPSPSALMGISILVATGLATLSYEMLEMPIRRSAFLDRYRMPVVAVGLTVSIVCGLVVAPAILHSGSEASSAPVPTSSARFTPVPAGLDLESVVHQRFGTTVHCVGKDVSACTLVKGSGKRILLMGDSNAEMMVPAFTALAKARHLSLTLGVTPACPWQRNVQSPLPQSRAECQRNREDTYKRVIPTLKPDVIVTIDTEYPVELVGPRVLHRATLESISEMHAPGRTIVLVEPIVQAPLKPQPLPCLQRATYVEDCRFLADTKPSGVDRAYGEIAAQDPAVKDANWDRMACPYLPICDPIIGGIVVRWDHQHLTTAYSATLGDELDAYFRANGLLGG